MGLGKNDLELLIWLRRQGELGSGGWVAEIGAQQLSNSFLRATPQIGEVGALYGKDGGYVPQKPVKSFIHAGGYETQHETAPPARPFWEWLGYHYMAIDVDGSPDSLALDLNFDDVPDVAMRRCQLVTNYGTTEHVANQIQAFKVIHDLTAVGGVMVHNVPAQGFFNHGLVNYSPKFFRMLARSNHYACLCMNFPDVSEAYGLPENIISRIREFDAQKAERAKAFRFCDAGLIVALKKEEDMDFVPPLDVPNGAAVADARLRLRYWTVLNRIPLKLPPWPKRFFREIARFGRDARRKFRQLRAR